MKIVLLFISIVFCLNNSLLAQNKIPPVDQSPLDISYYPENYPASKAQKKTVDPLIARVIYSRPSMNGRKIFGSLIEYGKVWRLGANEATEIEFFKDVLINKMKVKKGRYSLYALPNANKWTIILNKEMDTWGAFLYDSTKDVVRIEVIPELTEQPVEPFTIYFEKNNLQNINLNIFWENTKVVLPIAISKQATK
ncbi:MAG: DUF2911 domain-containing protein [Sphingobacteriales bacterium]|nr:DUF2911 domain-containing protein [Sphingobacteriales bacterium]